MFAKGLLSLVTIPSIVVIGSIGVVKPKLGEDVRKQLAANEYVAHEWGTFTSLQGSDGVNQPGLHHGDETLPDFVDCPLGRFSYSGCLGFVSTDQNSPLATTQRMETPVIYFYANTPQSVEVKVDFPEGLVSEWFPPESSFLPANGRATELKNGQITWNTQITNEQTELRWVSPDDLWQAQRNVDSNQIVVENEPEQFIFYRGIGRFTTPFSTSSNSEGTLTLGNSASEPIPLVLLLNFDGEKGGFTSFNLAGNTNRAVLEHNIPQATLPVETYIASISETLKAHLIQEGLLPLEAQAMIDTWKRSYFRTPGLRALYILPRAWTDSLVPISFSRAPTDLQRVFVGRVEILTHKQEQALMQGIRDAIVRSATDESFYAGTFVSELGRFAEPKLWRARAMASSSSEIEFIDSLLSFVN